MRLERISWQALHELDEHSAELDLQLWPVGHECMVCSRTRRSAPTDHNPTHSQCSIELNFV